MATYIKVDEFEAIREALELLPMGDAFNALPKNQQDIICKADAVIVKLYRRKRDSNRKTAAYIAEKRKTDKNYARKKQAAERRFFRVYVGSV